MAQTITDAEQLMLDYASIWNDRDYSKIPSVVSNSFVMYDPLARADEITGPKGEVRGPVGLEAFIQLIAAGFPDFHVEILDMLSNDEQVMYEGDITMTHDGEFYGIPPTGRSEAFRYMGVIDVADGKVQEHRVYHNLLTVFKALKLAVPAVIPLVPKIAWSKINQIK